MAYITKFNISDFVKWQETSKGGKKFYNRGMVVGIDTTLTELQPLLDFTKYYIITEEDEEVSKYEKELELDIQSERESKLNDLFDGD